MAASSNVIPAGISSKAFSAAHTYSAKVPWPNENMSPNTSSPGLNRVTLGSDGLDDTGDIDPDAAGSSGPAAP